MKPRKSRVASRGNVVRAPSDVLEVLDRVLDRGIVIDAWLRVSVVGLTLVDIDARVVVASFRTYVQDGDAIAATGSMARPGRTPSKTPRTPGHPAASLHTGRAQAERHAPVRRGVHLHTRGAPIFGA